MLSLKQDLQKVWIQGKTNLSWGWISSQQILQIIGLSGSWLTSEGNVSFDGVSERVFVKGFDSVGRSTLTSSFFVVVSFVNTNSRFFFLNLVDY